MLSSLHSVSAAVIAGAQAPLQLNTDYTMEWSGGPALGRILSVKQRLQSSFVTQSSESLLYPRELASVEIEMLLSEATASSINCMHEMAIVEPVTRETLGTGLLIPNSAGSSNHSGTATAPGLTLWLTGLSGAGKTTIARQVQTNLCGRYAVEVLDADIVRTYLCKDLGYSREDRNENVRRLGFVADFLSHKGIVVLITAIAPYRETREEVRKSIGRFLEVYVNAPIAVCEQRDVKGLYKRARAGELPLFTGIDDPYEAPLTPDVECHTDSESIEASVAKVVAAIEQKLKIR